MQSQLTAEALNVKVNDWLNTDRKCYSNNTKLCNIAMAQSTPKPLKVLPNK